MTQDKTQAVAPADAMAPEGPAHAVSLGIPAAVWPPRPAGAQSPPRMLPVQPTPAAPPAFEAAHEGAPAPAAEAPVPPSRPVSPAGRPVTFDGQAGTAAIRTAPTADAAAATQQDAPKPSGIARLLKGATQKAAPQPSTPGKVSRAENAFSAMSFLALPFLAILLCLQTGAGFIFPSVYFPGEATVAATYDALAKSGQWLLPPANDALFAALPGHYWFMHLIKRIPGVDLAFFLPLVACLAAFVALAGTYALGMCAGLGRRVSFAGGLIMLSCLAFAPMTHYVGPDVLLAGLLAFSLACLCRGFMADRAYVWLGLGFVLAGLATLVGGLIGLWVPVLGSIIFVLWRGTLRRAHGLDAAVGFGLLLLCVCGWIGAVILLGGESAKGLAPLTKQLFAPFTQPLWPPSALWWHPAVLLLVGLLPWILTPFFVSWGRVLGGAWAGIAASRKESSGVAWLWICLVLGLLLCTVAGQKALFAVAPLLPVATLLLAKALLGLSPERSRLCYTVIAALFVLAGVAVAALALPAVAAQARVLLAPCIPANAMDALLAAKGLPVLGGVCIVAGLALYRFTDRGYPAGALAVCVLMVIVLMQPATLISSPSLKGGLAVELPGGAGMRVLPGAAKVEKKPAEAAKPVEAAPAPAKPVEATPAPAKAVEEAKPAEAAAPSAKPVEEVKPAEAAKPAEAVPAKPAEEAKPVEAAKPAQ